MVCQGNRKILRFMGAVAKRKKRFVNIVNLVKLKKNAAFSKSYILRKRDQILNNILA